MAGKAVNALIASEAVVVQRTDSNVTLAIQPHEVAALTKAMALDTIVFTVAPLGGNAASRSSRHLGRNLVAPGRPPGHFETSPLRCGFIAVGFDVAGVGRGSYGGKF